MKQSEAVIRKWVQIISDDYMHFTDEQKEYVIGISKVCDFEILPNDDGVIGWLCAKDFDCKKKLNVILLYCKPEKRGLHLRYMFRRLEEIAKQEGAVKITIGDSISGYKEEKFNRMLGYMGYHSCGHEKRI